MAKLPSAGRGLRLAALPLILAAGLAAGPALAQSAAPAAAPQVETIDVPAPVKATVDKLTGGKAKILKAFKAPAGLIGLGIELGPNKDTILYASADGKYLMQGMIIDSDGQNTTQLASQSVLPQPPSAAENFATLDKTKSYVWGKEDAPKELWILFDPNCIYCHKTYDDLKPAVEAGKVKVHIIQAGFLKQSSLGKAAAIMAAKDPAAALAEDESKFDEAQEEGSIKGDTSDEAAVAAVKANNAWMQAQGIKGTPYLLYKGKDGKIADVGGYDPDIDGLLAQIDG
ncbi:thiol:disulfide interchange protein DsbG [Pseudooceanicola sp. CBS1P-1]|uniref:Thiol:disulfide interchange protein DsbG n=1 Tax=Pseudooceanicola albus TaxID=2692189 RepID=A0A6L7G9R6_9RHOB|nr:MULTISPECIES: thiol:disulfide interchange protein DsbG [Pseudooceanicola]MBT9386288.1 thiol:disulfide interchange protein DsbG [Pseudooceanicola endophyticus]MXN20337.1 thiol:disulfide interchange protein DsbG [Pseudooceanicola albus]